MNNNKTINYLAIIPARSGSTGIKDKNILQINGKECFRYTLEPAMQSNIDKIFFSTDNDEYLKLYKKYCNKEKDVTFNYLRPNNISQKLSHAKDYIEHCLNFLREKGYNVLNFIILQPTSLFRTSPQINSVINYHKHDQFTNIKSVSPTMQTPYYMLYDNNEMVIKHNYKNRQEHRKTFILNGAYFVSSVENFKNNKTGFKTFIMSELEGMDMDEEVDLTIIRLLIEKNI